MSRCLDILCHDSPLSTEPGELQKKTNLMEGYQGHCTDLHLFLWGVCMLINAGHINILHLTPFVWVKSGLALVVSIVRARESECPAQVLTNDTH